MTFVLGFLIGAVCALGVYRFLYLNKCQKNEVLCNQSEKDKKIYQQLEEMMMYSGK